MNRRFFSVWRRVGILTGKADYLYSRYWVQNPPVDRWLHNALRNAIEEGNRARFSGNYTRLINAERELKDAIG